MDSILLMNLWLVRIEKISKYIDSKEKILFFVKAVLCQLKVRKIF